MTFRAAQARCRAVSYGYNATSDDRCARRIDRHLHPSTVTRVASKAVLCWRVVPRPQKLISSGAILVRRAAEANLHVLGGIIEWVARSKSTWNLQGQVHVEARGGQTFVRIDHRMPAGDHSDKGWRVTTGNQYLPRAHFGADVRSAINSASHERGRRLYCIDQASNEVVAAMSYHVDEDPRLPVFLTSIGLRVDEGGMPELYDRSRGAAFLLKQYVHEIARKIGRGGHVDIDAGSVELLKDLTVLGFKRAPKIKGLRPSGQHLRQQPLD